MLTTEEKVYIAIANHGRIEEGRVTIADLQRAESKLALCISGAKEASEDYRMTGNKAFRQIRHEAMVDARYWKRQLRAISRALEATEQKMAAA